MYKVTVEFEGTPNRTYNYNSEIKLLEDGIYTIVADNHTVYNNRVKIICCTPGTFKDVRLITSAKLIQAPPKPKKMYKKIIVNREKETVCVVWNDGVRTIMKPHGGDEFDVEKGIALCFMKRAYNNRGCYNDVFKDYEEVK